MVKSAKRISLGAAVHVCKFLEMWFSASYSSYCCIAGQFSRHQREIYEALLEVQEACMQFVYPGSLTLNDIYNEMLMLLGCQLQRLSVVPKELTSTDLQKVSMV